MRVLRPRVTRIIKQSSTNLAATRDRLLAIAPGLAGLLGYQRINLPQDVVAGLAVAAVIVPVGIANAQLAGLPPATGCTRASCRSWPTRSSARRDS